MYTYVLDTDVSDTCVSKDNTNSINGNDVCTSHSCMFMYIYIHHKMFVHVLVHMYQIHTWITHTYAYNLRGSVMRVETTLIRITLWCMYTERCICSPLHLKCQLIPNSNLNLLGLFSTERGKSDLKNYIIDLDLKMKKRHSKCNRLCIYMYTYASHTHAYNLRGSVMRVKTTLIRIIMSQRVRTNESGWIGTVPSPTSSARHSQQSDPY